MCDLCSSTFCQCVLQLNDKLLSCHKAKVKNAGDTLSPIFSVHPYGAPVQSSVEPDKSYVQHIALPNVNLSSDSYKMSKHSCNVSTLPQPPDLCVDLVQCGGGEQRQELLSTQYSKLNTEQLLSESDSVSEGYRRCCTAETEIVMSSIRRLSPQKLRDIHHWLDGGEDPYNSVNVNLTTHSENFPNHVKILDFMPNFIHSQVGELKFIAGNKYEAKDALFIMDTGSSENMATSSLLQSIYPNFTMNSLFFLFFSQ